MTKHLLAAPLLVALWSTAAQAQFQFPPHEEERILPQIRRVDIIPPMLGPRSNDMTSRPIWYLPIGSTFRFRDERLILPHATRHAMGHGIMSNQFFFIAPAEYQRRITANTVWTLDRTEANHRWHLYHPHLKQTRHTIYQRWLSDAGSQLEIEICPGSNCTPSVGQFAEYFEITPASAIIDIP